jgi:hypothetical protein
MKSKKENISLPDEAVISQPFKRKPRFGLPNLYSRRFIPVLLLVVLLGAGAGGYLILQHFHKSPAYKAPLILPEGVEANYHTAPVSFLPVLLEHDYDLKVQDIESGNLSKQLKSFDMAYNIAVMLNRLDKTDRALEAYKIASIKTSDEKGLTFYVEYCSVAVKSKNASLSNQVCDTAADQVKKSNLSAEDKNSWLFSINATKNPSPDKEL